MLLNVPENFQLKKLSTDEREFVPSPFMRNQSRMQENNGYEKFTRSVSRLMETAQSWAQYKKEYWCECIGRMT